MAARHREQAGRLDSLTFDAMSAVLQSGMWLLNDLEGFLKPFGLSQGRLAILLSVQNSPDGRVNPADIARSTGRSRPTISRMMDRLLQDGLITVTADAEDGRRKPLRISGSGEAVLRDVVPEYNRRLAAISGALIPKDKKELCRILGKIDFLDEGKRIG